MKTTRIKVRAYCNEFDVEVNGADYFDIEKAEEYVTKHIIETGYVISVTYLIETNERTYINPGYKDPTKFSTSGSGLASRYLKRKP